MGRAFVALKRGRGQGGFAGASPQWAATAEPTQPPASFQCNPEGRGGGGDKWRLGGRASWERLGRFSALLARARPMRVLPRRSRLEKQPNRFQHMPFPFNQWFLRTNSVLHGKPLRGFSPLDSSEAAGSCQSKQRLVKTTTLGRKHESGPQIPNYRSLALNLRWPLLDFMGSGSFPSNSRIGPVFTR